MSWWNPFTWGKQEAPKAPVKVDKRVIYGPKVVKRHYEKWRYAAQTGDEAAMQREASLLEGRGYAVPDNPSQAQAIINGYRFES